MVCLNYVSQLGSGTALPGVVAAKVGATVTMSDACHLPDCQSNSLTSCQANGVDNVKVIGVTWGQFSSDVLQLPPQDIILASDCFYDTKGTYTIIFFTDLNAPGHSY